jgi:hypothetical protein
MEFFLQAEQDRYASLKEVFCAQGDTGYESCRLIVPRPAAFVPVDASRFRDVFVSGLVKFAESVNTDKSIVVAYSGGIDSESIAMGFILAGIPIELRTVAWRSNNYDLRFAADFARRMGVRHVVLDMDMNTYVKKDIYEWVWGAECAGDVYYGAEKVLIDKLKEDELLVIGAGAPPNVQCCDEGKWVLRNPLVDPLCYYQYARYRGRQIWCPYIDDAAVRATWTLDVLCKLRRTLKCYFEDIWQYGAERGVSEAEWREAKGILYSAFPDLPSRRKYHGWESELTCDLFQVANKHVLSSYFRRCLSANGLTSPADAGKIGPIPENPYFAQAMGRIPWLTDCRTPLDGFCDWDLSSWL